LGRCTEARGTRRGAEVRLLGCFLWEGEGRSLVGSVGEVIEEARGVLRWCGLGRGRGRGRQDGDCGAICEGAERQRSVPGGVIERAAVDGSGRSRGGLLGSLRNHGVGLVVLGGRDSGQVAALGRGGAERTGGRGRPHVGCGAQLTG